MRPCSRYFRNRNASHSHGGKPKGDSETCNTVLLLFASFNRAKVTDMLNYITVVHQPALHESEQETKRLGHTAPYVASEIFNSEIKSVCRQFFYEGELAEQIDSDEEVECFDQKENLDLLWKLFKPCQKVPINPVLAGYLEKTVQALVIQHPKELFTALFTKDEGASAL